MRNYAEREESKRVRLGMQGNPFVRIQRAKVNEEAKRKFKPETERKRAAKKAAKEKETHEKRRRVFQSSISSSEEE